MNIHDVAHAFVIGQTCALNILLHLAAQSRQSPFKMSPGIWISAGDGSPSVGGGDTNRCGSPEMEKDWS